MGYTKQAIMGVGWFGGLRVAVKALAIVKLAILARILSPSDFGVFGITVAVLALIERLTETGINTFLVQKRDDFRLYVNSAWVIAIVRGGIIALLLLLLSQILPQFYSAPSLFLFLIAASFIPFIKGFINPSIVKFWKELSYSKDAVYRGTISLSEGLLTIGLTLWFRSPVAMVLALVASAVLEVLLSHIVVEPRPKFIVDKKRAVSILMASRLLNLGSFFSFLVTNLDNLIVGKILGISALGFYQNAYNVANSTVGEIGDLSAQTVFPIYANIRDDKARLRRAVLRALVPLAIVASLPVIFILSTPETLVRILLGERWLAIVPLFPFLLSALYIKSLNAVVYPLFLALERVYLNVGVLFVQIIALVALIIPLSLRYGLLGASSAVLFSYIIIQPLLLFFVVP
ncbi:MAG TPA: oligosaccharide flippase family protein, partial [Patescibacteria group bacterium]|nr:oligosaccharide flippase family protein [Patescibacteria group bacterium]